MSVPLSPGSADCTQPGRRRVAESWAWLTRRSVGGGEPAERVEALVGQVDGQARLPLAGDGRDLLTPGLHVGVGGLGLGQPVLGHAAGTAEHGQALLDVDATGAPARQDRLEVVAGDGRVVQRNRGVALAVHAVVELGPHRDNAIVTVLSPGPLE